MFKEPRNHTEAISIGQRRDALIKAADALDYCKVEPDTSGKLRRIARQMDDAIRAAEAKTYRTEEQTMSGPKEPIEVTTWEQASNTDPLPEGTEVVFRGPVLDDLIDDVFDDADCPD